MYSILTTNMDTGGNNLSLIKNKIGILSLTPSECARLQGFNDDFIWPKELIKFSSWLKRTITSRWLTLQR